MKFSVIVLLVLTASFCSVTTALSRLKMESSPGTIHPILSKSLHITCIVQNENFKAFTTTSPWLLQSGNTIRESLWNDSAVSAETPAAVSSNSVGEADFSKLLSLTVTKQNTKTGLNETIASVVGCNIPVIEKEYEGAVKVEGNTEGSPRNGEQGYIRLTWDRPVDKHAGLFNCEANALNSDKHSESLSASLKVDAVEPKISDLVNYISTNDRYISDLKSKVSEIYKENRILKDQAKTLVAENADIQSRLDQIKSPNIQTGTVSCGYEVVNFNPAFNCTPKVFTLLSSMNANLNYGNGYFNMGIQSVTNATFVTSCNVNYWTTSFIWLAIELCD